MKNVLVLTYGEDPHADIVTKYFSENGVSFFRVDTEKLAEKYFLTFDSNILNYKISDGQTEMVLDSSWNIWNRRVMNPDVRKGPRSITDLIFEESEKTWDGLLMSHKGKVVNRPQNHFFANNKVDQLRFASRFNKGIVIPDTLVTNNPDDAIVFYKKHNGNICFKLQKGIIVDSPEGYLTVYTNKVSLESLENVELVRSHPCFFQEYIDKKFEVRIVSTDKEAIGIAIYSQESEISKVDFRRYDFEKVPYKYIELPSNVSEFCLEMLRNYDLHFGVFDFIYSDKGNYVFLELNPNGQWLWLEEQSGCNLTKLVAENLID